MLSREMDTIKNQLAEAEKSLKVQEDEICAKFAELNAKDLKLHAKDAELHDKDAKLHAKDVKIQAANAELGRKDKHIQTLKEDAANAVKKDQKSNECENLMEQWFQMGYNASHSQGSSLHAYEYWPPLEPVSGCEPKQTFQTQDYLQGNALKKSEEEKKLMKLKGAVKMKRKIPQNRSLFTTL